MKVFLLGLIVVLMSNHIGMDCKIEDDILGYKECYHDIVIEYDKSLNCILKKIVRINGEFNVFIERTFSDGTQSRQKFSVKNDCVENIISKLDEVGYFNLKPVNPNKFFGIEEDNSEAIYNIYKELRLGQNNIFFFGKHEGRQVKYNVYDIEMVVDERYSMVFKLMCDFFNKFK